jgi:ketosteroid isomerase-like protein
MIAGGYRAPTMAKISAGLIMKRIFALLALTAALAGCQSLQNSSLFAPRPATPSVATAPTTPTTSFGSSPLLTPSSSYSGYSSTPVFASGDRGSLLEADRQLAITAQEKGLGVAISAAAETEAVVLTPAGAFQGSGQITSGLASSAAAGPLFWQPEKADLSSSSDFGQTSGRYIQVLKGAEAVQGRYLTVWRKDSAGVWKIVSNVIMPTPRPPAAPAKPAVTPKRRR